MFYPEPALYRHARGSSICPMEPAALGCNLRRPVAVCKPAFASSSHAEEEGHKHVVDRESPPSCCAPGCWLPIFLSWPKAWHPEFLILTVFFLQLLPAQAFVIFLLPSNVLPSP